jgi:MFS family permease
VSSLAANPRLLCAYRALQMILFPVSIVTLFFRHRIGMSMTESLVVQAFLGLVVAVSEFPSGYVADRIGYRWTLIAAAGLGALGWAVYAIADTLPVIVLAQAVLGVSIALGSGCDSALMYEALLETGREDTFARWNGRVRFWGKAAEGTAALVAGMNRLIPSSDRVGYLSLRSLVFRTMFLALGPGVGAAVDAHGQHPVLLALGAALTALYFGLWLRLGHHQRRAHSLARTR